MFQPIPALHQLIDDKMNTLQLTPGKYTAAHVRARYPTGGIKGHDKEGGLDFHGKYRDKIIYWSTNAINCAIMLYPNAPVYFASDSHDAVNYIINDSPFFNSTYVRITGQT